jgi:hypothetical protein
MRIRAATIKSKPPQEPLALQRIFPPEPPHKKKIIGGNTRPEGSRDPALLSLPEARAGFSYQRIERKPRHVRGFKVMRRCT